MLGLLRVLISRRVDPLSRLMLGQLLMFMGVAAQFPVVPLYVAHRGGNSGMVGFFIAGPMLANTVFQIPGGALADRFGRKPMLLVSRAAYVATSALLFLDVGPLWTSGVLRLLQGASSGLYVPALRATIADLTPPSRRGDSYAQLQSVEMFGLLVGPLAGGLAGLWRDSAVFGCAAVGVALGMGALARMPETRREVSAAEVGSAPAGWWRRLPLVTSALGLATLGLMFSLYDAIWPQYLHARGYSSLIIGMTISIYAIPIMLLTRQSGRIADRVGPRIVVPAALVIVASTATTYPALRSLWAIIIVGSVESAAIMVLEPTLFAAIACSAPPMVRARAMGLGGSLQFMGATFGSGVLASLYGVQEALPFRSASLVCLGTALACLIALPHAAPGASAAPAPPLDPQEV